MKVWHPTQFNQLLASPAVITSRCKFPPNPMSTKQSPYITSLIVDKTSPVPTPSNDSHKEKIITSQMFP